MPDDAFEAILDRAVPQALASAPQILEERSSAPDRLVELLNSPGPEREAVMKGDRQYKRATILLKEASSNLHERGFAFDAALVRLDLGKLRARRRAEPVC